MIKIFREVLGPFVFLILTVIALLFIALQPFRKNTLHRAIRIYRPLGSLFGFQAKQLNSNLQPTDQPAVYICNHQDDLDLFIWSYIWPKDTSVIAKKELLYIPIFGLAYWLAGGITIDRGDKKKAWLVIEQMAHKINSLNRSILVFPEGTRSNGKGLLKFKKGAFSAAIQAGVPIVPIAFSSCNLVDRNALSPRPALIEYMEPISTQGLTEDDAAQLALRCHTIIQNKIAELDEKVMLDEYNETLMQRARNYFHL